MTTRHAGYIVTLEREIRDDDCADTLTALKMIKGVVSVEPVVADPIGHIGRELAFNDIRNRLIEVFWAEKAKK